ncbi:MAG: tetratricopeptide repeat protein [Treponema sp.]|jgi:TolA-binding protein|nr:tetratricopeptide repeat protein [Treponema sp.]
MGGKAPVIAPADISADAEAETVSEDIAGDSEEFDGEEPADFSAEDEQAYPSAEEGQAEVSEEPELSESDKPPGEPPVSVQLPEPAPAEVSEAVPEIPAPAAPVDPTPAAPPPPEAASAEPPSAPVVPAEPLPPEAEPLPPARPQAPPARTEPPPFIRSAEEPSSAPVREIPPPPAVPEPPAFIEIPVPAEEEVIFSRVVRATTGQLIEIPFRGTGWVYLGELASRQGIAYNSRRLDPEGQSFIFRAEAAGTYALKFYKQDFIRDYILNDYVQVIIGEAPDNTAAGWFSPPVDRGRVVAEPRWPTIAEEAEMRRSGSSGQNAEDAGAPDTSGAVRPPASGTALPADGSRGGNAPETGTPGTGVNAGGSSPPAVQTPALQPQDSAGVPEAGTAEGTAEAGQVFVFPEDSLPEAYFKKALEEFNAGRVGGAIAVLDGFRERFPSGSDEAWWLLGQFYEASSPSRDIRAALDYYRRLIREYPQSRRYNDARRRIAYLERFYINIQ